jgi:hypothetical protein
MKKLLAVLFIAGLLSSCTKTYPTQIIYDGIKNPVTIYLHLPSYNGSFTIYDNASIVAAINIPDSIIVADSSRLSAQWYEGSTAMTADTVASPGLVWTIQ